MRPYLGARKWPAQEVACHCGRPERRHTVRLRLNWTMGHTYMEPLVTESLALSGDDTTLEYGGLGGPKCRNRSRGASCTAGNAERVYMHEEHAACLGSTYSIIGFCVVIPGLLYLESSEYRHTSFRSLKGHKAGCSKSLTARTPLR